MTRIATVSAVDGSPIETCREAIGLCFATSLAFHRAFPDQATLCHGIAMLGKPRVPSAHGWCEVYQDGQWFVRDAIWPRALIARESYYRRLKIDPRTVIHYDLQKSTLMSELTQHCGPWDARCEAASSLQDALAERGLSPLEAEAVLNANENRYLKKLYRRP